MASWHDVLELHGIKKTPPGKLSSKADFLRLLYGSVDGNFSGLGPDFHRSALLTISAIYFCKVVGPSRLVLGKKAFGYGLYMPNRESWGYGLFLF